MRFCAERGIRANMCMGAFREHDEFLDIAERVALEHDFRDRNWVLQHAITITPAQVRRYADLGFQVTTSAGFAWGKGKMYGERMANRSGATSNRSNGWSMQASTSAAVPTGGRRTPGNRSNSLRRTASRAATTATMGRIKR